MLTEQRHHATIALYRALRTPRVRIPDALDLLSNADHLYDGRMIAATTAWWNTILDRRPALATARELRKFTATTTERLAGAPNPSNRGLLDEQADGPATVAAVQLGYAFARTLWAGTRWDDLAESRRAFKHGRDVSAEMLNHLAVAYSPPEIADMREMLPGSEHGWWGEQARNGAAYGCVVPAIEWAFRDAVGQVGLAPRARGLFKLGGYLAEAELPLR